MAEGQPSDGKNSIRNKMRKKKKKFLANVKGFGKQGNFGRGTHLESDEWNYYINILDVMKKGFDSLEDKSMCTFLNMNVDEFFLSLTYICSIQLQWPIMFWSRRLTRRSIHHPIKLRVQSLKLFSHFQMMRILCAFKRYLPQISGPFALTNSHHTFSKS